MPTELGCCNLFIVTDREKEGVELAIFEGTNQLQDIPGMYGFTFLTTGNLSNYTQ